MAVKFEDKRIDEALELLNEVAKEKSEELHDMVSEKYSHLKSVLGGIGEKSEHDARDMFAEGSEEAKEIASKVNERVHKNPWPVIGGTALGFFILGILLSKPKK
jgi:ElaB/YqjD/DUF883 family membrane-anchored ribosome-binding protein